MKKIDPGAVQGYADAILEETRHCDVACQKDKNHANPHNHRCAQHSEEGGERPREPMPEELRVHVTTARPASDEDNPENLRHAPRPGTPPRFLMEVRAGVCIVLE